MNIHLFGERRGRMFAPEHGGNVVKGGGHPSDSPVSLEQEIDDAFPQAINRPSRALAHSRESAVAEAKRPTRDDSSPSPTNAQISLLAWQFWNEEGRTDGHAEEHWRRAEEQLRAPKRNQ
jgi:hypothetical protein